MKKTVFLGFLTIMLFVGFIGCDNDNSVYTVTIGSLINGTITANPTSGVAGTEITLSIVPDNYYILKTGTLKYGSTLIDENTMKFNLPAQNITIIADFESVFIGTWYEPQGNRTYTFMENSFIAKNHIGKFVAKGNWEIVNSSNFIMIFTHYNSTGVEIIDDLPEFNSNFEFLIENSTNTSFTLIGTGDMYGANLTFTLNQ